MNVISTTTCLLVIMSYLTPSDINVRLINIMPALIDIECIKFTKS